MNFALRSALVATIAFFALGCGCGQNLSESLFPPGDGGQDDVAVAEDAGAADGDGGCGLATCASIGATCGLIGDGCGGILDCGTCTPPQTCGGGGVPSACGGTAACVARTCAELGFDCGPAGDGCGGTLNCGTCAAPRTCGGGGTAGVCGSGGGGSTCTPTTCAAIGFDCGPAGDGCGGTLNCGTCAAPRTCGGGGAPSVCGGGTTVCTPLSCADFGYNCGLAGDGCGGTIDCGTCTAPAICGGGTMPNVCSGTTGGTCVNLCLRQMTCPGGATSTISGTVYAPTNPALGYGAPDPIYNAFVYVPNAAVEPFAPGVSCDRCGAPASGSPLVSFTTSIDGTFTITNAPCGADIPLVIQLGRWRRQIVIPNVTCCADTMLTADQTRLPRNQSEGDIPLIAFSTGRADPIECALLKIGIEASEFTQPSGAGRVHIYRDNGASLGAGTPAASTLYGSLAELSRHDMVIFDCVGSQQDKTPTAQANVISYADAGGRVFASHFSYVWLYNVVPFSTTAAWNVNQTYPPDLTAFIDTSFPKGVALSQWLMLVGASTTLGQIPVQDVRHDTDAVNNPPSQRWMYADPAVSPDTPLEFTFNTPIGTPPDLQCGRVLFSDFHVNTGGTGSGSFPDECGAPSPMTAQEKLLEFLLFDLASCIAPDVPPACTRRTCADWGYNCGAAGDGCGSLIPGGCGTCPAPATCGGAGIPGVCGGIACGPRTCAAQGIGCGPAGDGCGGALDCGTCTPPATCGGGGTPGICGTLPCVPRTCAQQGYDCGPAGDGCGGALDCGTCTPPETCGGGGWGLCGGVCVPRTCVQVDANCGFVADGCGGVIDCGTCTAPDLCGGLGVPNQCGHVV